MALYFYEQGSMLFVILETLIVCSVGGFLAGYYFGKKKNLGLRQSQR